MTTGIVTMRRSNAVIAANSSTKILVNIYCLFLVLSSATFIAQFLWTRNSIYAAVFIPDTVSMNIFLSEISTNTVSVGFLLDNYPSPLVMLIYLPLFYVHPLLCWLLNVIMLAVSIFMAFRLFWPIGSYAATIACLGIVLNPYFYLAEPMPNKEIPLLLLTLLYFYWTFAKGHFIRPMCVAVVVYYIRDGYGQILFIWLLLLAFYNATGKRKLVRLSILALPLIASTSFALLKDFIPSIQRNIDTTTYAFADARNAELSTAGMERPAIAIPMFVFRACANGYAMFIRSSCITMEGQLALVGLAYWLYGFMLALGISAVVVSFLCNFNKPDVASEVFCAIFIWLSISVSLFVQGRYLMPILPILLGFYGALPRLIRVKLLLFVFIAGILSYGALVMFNVPAPVYKDNFMVPVLSNR